MNLASKLNIESAKIEAQRMEVVNEIVDYFKDIFESGKFEKVLERNITPDNKADRSKKLCIEFWDYHSGCSDTHFRTGLHVWKNPEGTYWDSRTYKGIELHSIQQEVGRKLLNLTDYYLKDLGFKVIVRDDESRFGYYRKEIEIRW